MAVWKSKTEAYHGSKWGFVAVALIIVIVLSLLGSIFYLIGEGMKATELDPGGAAIAVVVVIVLVIILVILAWYFSSVFSFFAGIWNVIWTLFSNMYVLVVFVVISALLLLSVYFTASASIEISLANPLVIGILIALFIMFLPFAIFMIDLFTYEHE